MVSLVSARAALFWRSQRIRETALRATRRHCEREEVLLLDQTVGLKRFRLARDERGRWGLWRIYAFEFTVTGGERYQGVYDEKIQGFYVEACGCEEEE